MFPQLTHHGIFSLFNDPNAKPTLQITNLRALPPTPTIPDRYGFLLSDGEYYTQGVFSSQLGQLAASGQIIEGSVIIIDEFVKTQGNSGKLVMVVTNARVLPGNFDVANYELKEAEQAFNQDQDYGQYQQQHVQPQHQQYQQHQQVARQPARAAPAPQHQPIQHQQQQHQQQQQQQYQQHYQHDANEEDLSTQPIQPIKSLNPYQNRWTIKARVTSKSDIRPFKNARGPGKLASVDVLDAQQGEIRVMMFNDAVDKFHPMLEVGSVYFISRGSLKFANKKFSTLKCDYEITLSNDSIVQPAHDEQDIPRQQFNFVNIDTIEATPPQTLVDVLAICKNVSPLQSVTTRNQEQLQKRVLTLLDSTCTSIDLTVWGEQAIALEHMAVPSVVAVKNAKIGDYGGRTLSTIASSRFELNPDVAEAHQLLEWYDSQQGNVESRSITVAGAGGSGGRRDAVKTLAQGRDDAPAAGASNYWSARATVTTIYHDGTISYDACPNQSCRKKVIEMGGKYHCEAENQQYDTCEPRYVLNMLVADNTASMRISAFGDQGNVVMGRTAAQVKEARADPAAFEQCFEEAVLRFYNFKIRSKFESYNEEERLKHSIVSVTPVNFANECKSIVAEINSYA